MQNQSTGFSCITTTITANIPWAFTFILAIVYFIIIVAFAGIPGRKKYVYISLVMMIISWAMELYGVVPVATAAAASAIFFIVLFFVIATGSQQ